MSRTICRFRVVASGCFCVLILWFSAHTFGQQLALPPLYPINVHHFAIPFDAGSSSVFREVELFVSRDRGRHWQFVARQSIESGQFPFRAPADGEYWFAFRRLATAGSGSPAPFSGSPQLRVLVDTTIPAIELPPPTETRALTPPRPQRYQPGNRVALPTMVTTQTAQTEASASEPESRLDNTINNTITGFAPLTVPPRMQVPQSEAPKSETPQPEVQRLPFGPRLPGFDPSAAVRDQRDLLEDLLSGMSHFMDVQPVVRRAVPSDPIAERAIPTAPSPSDSPSDEVVPGGIAGGEIIPDSERPPRIAVKWHRGPESWHDAQIDVLRGSTREGPWIPIATNLPNNGEYWWYLTSADTARPFYLAIRIRSFTGGVQMSITPSITIDVAQLPTPFAR